MLPDRNIAAKADNRVEAEKCLKKLKEREQKETDVPLYIYVFCNYLSRIKRL